MEHNRSLPREVLTFVHAGPAGKHRAAVENIGACRMRGVEEGGGRNAFVPWGNKLGTGLLLGEKEAGRQGKGSRGSRRRAAEATGAELRSAAKPRCLRGQPWGPGLLSPQGWQKKKSQRERQLLALGTNPAPIPAPCLPFLPWGVLGGSFLACFAAHKTFPGLEAMAGEATSFSPPTHINAVYLHFASHRRRKLAFSLCRDESTAQTHT